MINDNIRDVVEEKIKKLQNEWYETKDYSDDELINWFLDISWSLLDNNKEDLTGEDKNTIRKKVDKIVHNIFYKWYYDFIIDINKLDITLEEIEKSTTDKDVIASINFLITNVKKINNFLPFKKKNPNYRKEMDLYKLASVWSWITLSNNIEVIKFTNEKKGNVQIKEMKKIFKWYYKKCSDILKIEDNYIKVMYEKWKLSHSHEKMVGRFIKVDNELN